MIENTTVSIIVPVYNGEKSIEKCINSLLNQTYKNLQIIIVDDGSTDDTYKKCNLLQDMDERIHYIHIQNQGVSNARNCGLKLANGKYVTFVDCDDYIENNMYEIMVQNIEKFKTDACICSYLEHEGNRQIIQSLPWNNNTVLNKEKLTKEYIPYILGRKKGDREEIPVMGSVCRILYCRDLIQELTFETDIALAEDAMFCIRVALEKIDSMVVVNEPLYHYVRFDNSSSSTYKPGQIERDFKYYDRVLEVLDEKIENSIYWLRYCLGRFQLYIFLLSKILNPNNNFTRTQQYQEIIRLIKKYKEDDCMRADNLDENLSFPKRMLKVSLDKENITFIKLIIRLRYGVSKKNRNNFR
jgi:glycosyltransferase involved in cell wall biosynthesis